MSNQLQNKTAALAAILAQNKLVKSATDQEIEHTTPTAQTSLGAEQTSEIRDGMYNVNADTAAAKNNSKDKVQEEPAGITPLNKTPEAALASTGTDIKKVDPNGDPNGTMADKAPQGKAASYQYKLASILAADREMAKQAAQQPEIMTGTEVMQKLAALTEQSPKEAFEDAKASIIKLASTNPLFNICKERIMMEKQATDIRELATAKGISVQEAAEMLDKAAAEDPEMAQALDDEATGEAIDDLANVEQQAAEMGPALDQMAANASQVFGTEVTPDDIMAAADEVAAQAEQLGVPPEALIQAAMEEMQGGAGPEPTEEDMENARQLMEAGAAQGLSPEEVIEVAAQQLGEGGGEAPAEPAAAPAPEEQKTASFQFTSPRAAFVYHNTSN